MSTPHAPSMPPIAQLFQLITGKWVAASIATAARLGVADHLEMGTRSARELAQALNVNERALYRLLRALASVGVFHEEDGHRFAQSPLSDLLRTNAAPRMRYVAMMTHDGWSNRDWESLDWCIETGRPAPYKLYGMSAFEYFAANPDEAINFNHSMTDLSMGDGPNVVASYDFSKFEHIVDVGGGHGGLLAAILHSAPRLKGTLFDMPYVIEQARQSPILAPFADRCTFEGGSFLESVPSGADAYIMKHIIHDWDDEGSLKILKHCRKGLRHGGTLLVVDRVVGPPNQPDSAKFLDLEMLVSPGGLERDEHEWRALFAAAGFRLAHIIPTHGPQSILQGTPA